MYKISVIIPIYNAEKTLTRALDSIVNQTMDFKDIGVIMVDDASTDGSLQIIGEYCGRYDNFISFNLSENTGSPSKPRNIGIDNASSDYIMFLDSDDLLDSRACEFLYDFMISEDVDLVSGYITFQGQDNKYHIDVFKWVNLFDQTRDAFKIRRNRVDKILNSDELAKIKINNVKDNGYCLSDHGFF